MFMKKFDPIIWNKGLLPFLLCISIFHSSSVFAQKKLSVENAMVLVAKNAKALSFSTSDVSEVLVSSAYHDNILNADLVYLQQTIHGIPVLNSIKSVVFKNDKVVSVSGKFFSAPSGKSISSNTTPATSVSAAILAAAKEVNLKPTKMGIAQKTSSNNRKFEFDNLGISQTNVTADLIWQTDDNNSLKLVWQVKIVPRKTSDYWLIQVDAISGKAINKMNLTVFCSWDGNKLVEDRTDETISYTDNFLAPPPVPGSINNGDYRVLPFPVESPAHGTFSVQNNPWTLAGIGNAATAFGWHNDGTTEYNITRGNNVWSKEDRAGDNESTIGASTTSTTAAPNYTFNDVFDPLTSATGATNQKAAITNLFYWNNIVHDITYQYGFDEASGNFQNDNQGLGGSGADYVLADAQDGSGSNNANFSTPVDGSRPRMQMFLFSPSPSTTLTVNSSPITIPAMNAFEAVISANNKLPSVGPKTGDVVLYDISTNNGCTAIPAGSLTGKIAVQLFDGLCNPSLSVKNAQNAGAIGVIMQLPSNIPAAGYSGGTDNGIIIPSVFIDFAPGNAIKTAMGSGTVNITLQGINLDGDFDNGVVVHEYGHGISNRLTGGPSTTSCLQNAEQMGEGWSDYYALMLTTNWSTATTADGPNKRPIGTYVIGQTPTGSGIRRFPYTTNMTINPWTYGMMAAGTNNPNTGVAGEVHLTGEIWAATLWDMTWNIIAQENNISSNLYDASATGGNNISMKLVTQGMKLQPCSPGFLDGRNAILKADTLLYGGKYSCAIWTAFARRGMGVNAVQGSSNSVLDQTENFSMPTITLDTTAVACDSLVWRGTTFKTSGNFPKTITVPGGCSATSTLHLTIKNSSATTETFIVCDSLVWNGTKYFVSGIYKYITPNAVGCDSVVTLNLTVNNRVAITSISQSNTPLCGGTRTTLTANGVAGTNALVTWYDAPGGTGNVVGSGLTSDSVFAGTYYARVTGVCGSPVEVSITLAGDVTNPSISCPSNVNISNTNTLSCTKAVVLTSPTFSDNCKVKALSWTLTGATNAVSSGTGIRPINGITLSSGTTTITYVVKDFSDLSSTCSFTVTINDIAKPSFTTAPTNINVSIPTGCSSSIPVPGVSFSDNCGTPSLTWVATGATIGNSNGQVGTMIFNIGTTMLTYTLADANSNVRTASITVKVVETEAPTISCPANISTNTIGTNCTKNIATIDPSYADNCGFKSLTWAMTGAITLSSPATGIWTAKTKKFNAGFTFVKYIITDFSGNVANCSYTVLLNSTNNCPSFTTTAKSIVVNEEATKLRALLSPNPTSSNFLLRVISNKKDAVDITVYNNEGKKVEQFKTNNLSNIILGKPYTSGSYLFEIRQGEKRTTVTGVKQ